MPPPLLSKIAVKLNKSHCQFLTCFHGPSVLFKLGFQVELIPQLATRMHGSGEIHQCFIYRCPHPMMGDSKVTIPCARRFSLNVRMCEYDWITQERLLEKELGKGRIKLRITRSVSKYILNLFQDLHLIVKKIGLNNVEKMIMEMLLGTDASPFLCTDQIH